MSYNNTTPKQTHRVTMQLEFRNGHWRAHCRKQSREWELHGDEIYVGTEIGTYIHSIMAILKKDITINLTWEGENENY